MKPLHLKCSKPPSQAECGTESQELTVAVGTLLATVDCPAHHTKNECHCTHSMRQWETSSAPNSVYACTHCIPTHRHMHMCTQAHTKTYMHSIHTHIFTPILTWTHVTTHTKIHICTQAYRYSSTDTQTCIHEYAYTRCTHEHRPTFKTLATIWGKRHRMV